MKLTEYEDVADAWGKVSGRANGEKDRVDNEMLGTLRETQTGEAATRAAGDLSRLSRNYQYIHTECGLIRTALNALAAELALPQRKLKQALEDAENLKFTVNPDGTVTYPVCPVTPLVAGTGTAAPGAPLPRRPGTGEGGADPYQGRAEDIAERIAAAVLEADGIDHRYANILRRLRTTGGLRIDDAMFADAARDTGALQAAAGAYADAVNIPKGKTPAQNAAWWRGLTQERRDEYATLYPGVIGALDGIPSTVRDDANRMVLAEAHARTRLALDALGPEPPRVIQHPTGGYPVAETNPAWTTWHTKRERLQARLRGMDAIQRRFDAPPSSGLPPAFLLSFDPHGTGRAVIANGNPDSAHHTAVYVPGTTSRLEGIRGDINRMSELWVEGHSQAPGQSLSTITWLGYDAPQSLAPDAMQKVWAYEGSPKLNTFLEGLQTVQGGPDNSHTTVIGHSYGSTVVGDASNKGDLAADDIVAVGSPGMLAAQAHDLDVGQDHVWSEAGSTDPVPAAGKLVGLGGSQWTVGTWNGIPYHAGYIQTVPSDEAFGAHRMDVDTIGHGGYWNRDSLSLKNQAFVATSKYDRVKED